jgi:hypothetical protein
MTIEKTGPVAADDMETLDLGPFRRPGLGRRALPFALVAGVAEASLALPPGPKSFGFTVLSLILLLLAAVAMLLPWES